MDISPVSNASTQRPVTQSKSGSDRQPNNEALATNVQHKAQESTQERRAVQERWEQRQEDHQRRLDGRLISFGQPNEEVSDEQRQVSLNRSRVNEAYNHSKNDSSNSHEQHSERSYERDNEAIDIVV